MKRYPKSYIQFLAHFHGDRDYFECHEILEEYWKASDARNKNSIWVGLILLAVSNYHYRRSNISGAIRTLNKSIQILDGHADASSQLGIDHRKLIEILKKREKHLGSGVPYSSFNLPLSDPTLVKLCQAECKENGFIWGSKSDLTDLELIHRHSLRDRNDIISEREMALQDRKNKKRQCD